MNKHFVFYVFLFVYFVWSVNLIAQTSTTKTFEDQIERSIEQRSDLQNESFEQTEIIDELNDLSINKLNINTSTSEDISKLTMLNALQIEELVKYRNRYGKILSIAELYTLTGFSQIIADELLPFICFESVSNKKSVKEILFHGQHELVIRSGRTLQQQDGYISKEFLGNPYKLFTRYKFSSCNKISAGIAAEKDAGEQFFKATQNKGFDFYSGHICFKNLWKFSSVIVGDYHTQFGQGLVLSTGYSGGKSVDIMNIKKRSNGIKPFSSAAENNYLRGVASTLRLNKFEITALISHKRIDANISNYDSTNKKTITVSSLQTSGYHTTSSEVLDKDALQETIFGSNIQYRIEKLRLGITGYHLKYDADLIPQQALYNMYNFKGKSNSCGGFNVDYTRNDVSLFGEAAMSKNHGKAYLVGLLSNLSTFASMSVLYRNYKKEYQNVFANAFTENSQVANEQGLFTGITLNAWKNISISGYADRYTFPWLRYGVDAPSRGTDYLFICDYNPNYNVQLYVQWRLKSKQQNDYEGKLIDNLSYNEKQNLRFHLTYKPSETWQLRGRVEVVKSIGTDNEKGNGYLFFQDIIHDFEKAHIKFYFRYALFECDSYDERIYAYEHDVQYAFSVPSFYGRGFHISSLLVYQLNEKTDCSIRFSNTHYTDRSIISSGLYKIKGNNKSDVSLQFVMKF